MMLVDGAFAGAIDGEDDVGKQIPPFKTDMVYSCA